MQVGTLLRTVGDIVAHGRLSLRLLGLLIPRCKGKGRSIDGMPAHVYYAAEIDRVLARIPSTKLGCVFLSWQII